MRWRESCQDDDGMDPDRPVPPTPKPDLEDRTGPNPRLPLLLWVAAYRRRHLGRDLAAGGLVAMLLIPQAFAYAHLADLPSQAGLRAALVAPVIYALFGRSRDLSLGPVALVSLLVGEAVGRGEDAAGTALILAALAGGILLAIGLFRLGFVFRAFTRPVLAGFISAAALLIAITQLEHLVGVDLKRGVAPFHLLVNSVRGLDQARPGPLALGLAVLFLLLAGPPLLRRVLRVTEKRGWKAGLVRALPMLVMLAAAGAVAFFRLDQRAGVPTLGSFDLASLAFTFPRFDGMSWLELVPSALTIAAVASVTTLAIADSLSFKRGEVVSKDQELFSLGATNVALSMTGGYPVGGSLSRSAVISESEGHSPLAAVFAAAFLLFSAFFLSPLLAVIPRAALAALVLAAALTMVDRAAFVDAWRNHREALIPMSLTFAAVIFLGIELGILMALVAGLGSLGWDRWRDRREAVVPVGRKGETEGTEAAEDGNSYGEEEEDDGEEERREAGTGTAG